MKLEVGTIYHSKIVTNKYFKVLKRNELEYRLACMYYHTLTMSWCGEATITKLLESARKVSKLEMLLKVPKELKEAQ